MPISAMTKGGRSSAIRRPAMLIAGRRSGGMAIRHLVEQRAGDVRYNRQTIDHHGRPRVPGAGHPGATPDSMHSCVESARDITALVVANEHRRGGRYAKTSGHLGERRPFGLADATTECSRVDHGVDLR